MQLLLLYFFFIFKENKKMASKKVEQKKKVLRFGFKIHDAVDYEIDKKTPEIIDSISSASLVKALELVARQHCGCNCYPFATANCCFQYGYDIIFWCMKVIAQLSNLYVLVFQF